MAEDDKIQRQMEFIVTNQAQFTSDIQELKVCTSRLRRESRNSMMFVCDLATRW